ncbi:MAG: hypothetical protein MUE69_18790 [Myxococcota bacterium]|jgi:hypothetical protein|nr:hypothetical protein [Myxococcota bacterium]
MVLNTFDQSLFLRLDLYPPTEPGHDEWVEYQVTVGRWRSPDKLIVGSDPSYGALYLDAGYAPEVPELCDALELLVREGTAFSFTPADAGEVTLRAQRGGEGVLVLGVLFSELVQRRLSPEWRSEVVLSVSDDAALAFAAGLRLEMRCLAHGVPTLR